MKIAPFFVTLLVLFDAGLALNCYKCNGCETTSTVTETCRNADPETHISLCMTQRIRTGGTADSMTIKKCAVHEKGKPFECPNLPSGDTILCQNCDTNFCNSGSKFVTNFYFLATISLILVALRFSDC